MQRKKQNKFPQHKGQLKVYIQLTARVVNTCSIQQRGAVACA
jgi:hypothetical protein